MSKEIFPILFIILVVLLDKTFQFNVNNCILHRHLFHFVRIENVDFQNSIDCYALIDCVAMNRCIAIN